jgi:hypothetical protein
MCLLFASLQSPPNFRHSRRLWHRLAKFLPTLQRSAHSADTRHELWNGARGGSVCTLWEPPGARFSGRPAANRRTSLPQFCLSIIYRGGEYVAGRARTRASGRPGTRVARDRLDRILSVHPSGRVRGVVGHSSRCRDLSIGVASRLVPDSITDYENPEIGDRSRVRGEATTGSASPARKTRGIRPDGASGRGRRQRSEERRRRGIRGDAQELDALEQAGTTSGACSTSIVRMSRARLPILSASPSRSSRRSVARKRKGPKDATLNGAAGCVPEGPASA